MRRIGVDVGGTFTDLIYIDDEAGTVIVHKTPSTPADPSIGTVHFTTIELAREAYGVVISDDLVIDEAASTKLRAELRCAGDDFHGELLTLVSTPHPMAISPYAKAT